MVLFPGCSCCGACLTDPRPDSIEVTLAASVSRVCTAYYSVFVSDDVTWYWHDCSGTYSLAWNGNTQTYEYRDQWLDIVMFYGSGGGSVDDGWTIPAIAKLVYRTYQRTSFGIRDASFMASINRFTAFGLVPYTEYQTRWECNEATKEKRYRLERPSQRADVFEGFGPHTVAYGIPSAASFAAGCGMPVSNDCEIGTYRRGIFCDSHTFDHQAQLPWLPGPASNTIEILTADTNLTLESVDRVDGATLSPFYVELDPPDCAGGT